MPIEKHFIPPQPNSEITDKEISGLVKALFAKEGYRQKTVLTPEQVIAIARAESLSELYSIPELHMLCELLMELKISQGGRGRTDMTKVLQSRGGKDFEDIRERARLIGN